MAVAKRSDEDTTRSDGPDDEGPDEGPDAEDTAEDPAETTAAEPEDKPLKPARTDKGYKKEKAEGKQSKAVQPVRTAASGPRRGYFTIYKSGQGYWTRMGTLIAVGLLGLMLSFTLYEKIPPFLPPADTAALQKEVTTLQTRLSESQHSNDPAKKLPAGEEQRLQGDVQGKQIQIANLNAQHETFAQRVGIGVAIGFLIVYSIIAIWLMNKPVNVDFLIATDSEMKKVNWTSRKELTGSTKVVVVFMFLIAAFLFLIDQVFHLMFWATGVLKSPPPWWPKH